VIEISHHITATHRPYNLPFRSLYTLLSHSHSLLAVNDSSHSLEDGPFTNKQAHGLLGQTCFVIKRTL